MQDRRVFFSGSANYAKNKTVELFTHIYVEFQGAKGVPARQIAPTRRRDGLLLYALNFRFEGRSIPYRFGRSDELPSVFQNLDRSEFNQDRIPDRR